LGWVALLVGCGARGDPGADTPPAAGAVISPPEPPDTMVLAAPGGITVWLTEGRRASDPAGAPCFERSIEIRRDTTHLKVPLLYTLAAPSLLDDSTLKAELARNCRPAAAYRVSLRTGAPTRIKP
jgi:hypothetical protein